MERALTFADVRRALAAKDGDLADRIVALAEQPDPQPGVAGAPPLRAGAPTFAALAAEVRAGSFARKTPEERAHRRTEGMKALEAAGAEVELPDRARAHEVILELWQSDGAFERDALLEVLRRAPLRWGAWRALKRIFKEAEARADWEVLGVLAARFDGAFASLAAGVPHVNEISKKTLAYVSRRAWRALRRQAEQLPAAYPDAAVLVLSAYEDSTRWPSTWVANQIFFHDAGKHTRRRFRFDRRAPLKSLTQHRAYGDLWRRSPRPLFTLLARARSEQARAFAVAALKADFRASLREVEPPWVARLIAVKSATAHDFVVWLLGNVPRFEQGAFRELGLHAAGADPPRLPVGRGARLRRGVRAGARAGPLRRRAGAPRQQRQRGGPQARPGPAPRSRPAQGRRARSVGAAPRHTSRARARGERPAQALRRARADARVVQGAAAVAQRRPSSTSPRISSPRCTAPRFWARLLLRAARRRPPRRGVCPLRRGRAGALPRSRRRRRTPSAARSSTRSPGRPSRRGSRRTRSPPGISAPTSSRPSPSSPPGTPTRGCRS